MPSLGNPMGQPDPPKPQPRPQQQPYQHAPPQPQPPLQQQHHQYAPPQPNPQPNVVPGYPQTLGVTPQLGVWTTGLFDCFDDPPNCCLTCWCPCITFGQSAEIIDRGASSCGVTGALYALIAVFFPGFQFIYSCMYRTKLKQQYGMPQDTFEDCCLHFWCPCCALTQEYRELQHRGLEPTLGWHGNIARMNNATPLGVVTNPPGVHGGMTR